jgi:hypothetical protein
MDEVKENIFKFISKHESIISQEMDEGINVRFTTFGNRAGCRAVYEVISMLDVSTRDKVVEMMKHKQVK